MGRVEGRPEDGRHRPVIEVALTYAGRTIPVVAVVDSDADYTTIPVALGETLTGLPMDQIGRAGGNITGMGNPTPSRILDGVEVVYMGRIFARTIIVGEAPRMVVGVNDFMKVFDVRFYWSRSAPEFWIEPARTPKARKPAPNPTIRPRRKRCPLETRIRRRPRRTLVGVGRQATHQSPPARLESRGRFGQSLQGANRAPQRFSSAPRAKELGC